MYLAATLPGTHTFSDLHQRSRIPTGVVNNRLTVHLLTNDCIIYRPIRSKKDTGLI